MDKFVVQGGRRIAGSVAVSGAKNAALPIMAAVIASQGETVLENVPDLVDVRTLSALLRTLGVMVTPAADGQVRLQVVDPGACVADYQLVRQMRASICVLGPLLGRRGKACVSLPGGCNIGTRPIDLHLKGLAALGAEIEVRNGYVLASARRLRGAAIHLGGSRGSTVTGTCNVMSAAALAQGTTIITAAACEPEVVALADFLNAMGARIAGQGTPRLEIEGVECLQGTRCRIIPDRIEAATLLIAGAMTQGQVELQDVRPEHLTAVLELLAEIGCQIEIQADQKTAAVQTLKLSAGGPLHPLDVTALPYPGIPTDVQAQLMALACTIPGASVIRDQVFPDRFMHVAELGRMGARIRQQESTAVVSGECRLTGANVMASDLRASAALVLAALAAEGETTIRRIYHLDRGYAALEQKLNALGAHVTRLPDQWGTGHSPVPEWTSPGQQRKSA